MRSREGGGPSELGGGRDSVGGTHCVLTAERAGRSLSGRDEKGQEGRKTEPADQN